LKKPDALPYINNIIGFAYFFEEYLTMSISVTEAAAKQIEKSLSKRGSGLGLRLGVTKSGCTGFAYVLDFVDQTTDSDQVFESHGVKIIVDNDSLTYINGTQVDFVREGLNETFKFSNPNVKNQCGCGSSFAV
jgi:iron-sulfur cluster assembly protein